MKTEKQAIMEEWRQISDQIYFSFQFLKILFFWFHSQISHFPIPNLEGMVGAEFTYLQ